MTPIRMRVEYLLGRYEMFVRDCREGKIVLRKVWNWRSRFRTETIFFIIICSSSYTGI